MSPKRAWPPNCGELHCCPTRIACIGCRPEHVWCEIPCEPMCDQRDVSVVQTSRRQCRDCCDAWIFPKNFPAAAQPDASHPHDETISDTEEIASSGDPKDSARCFGEVDPLAPTCPFICGYQVFCQIDDVQHVLHTDGSQSLSEILLSFELQHAGYMVAIGSEGQVIPNSMLIEQDTHVPFHRVCSTAKVLCETGKTWVVCKAGRTIDQMKTDLLGLLSHLDLVAWDLALWPVHCISVTRTHSYFSLWRTHVAMPWIFVISPHVDFPGLTLRCMSSWATCRMFPSLKWVVRLLHPAELPFVIPISLWRCCWEPWRKSLLLRIGSGYRANLLLMRCLAISNQSLKLLHQPKLWWMPSGVSFLKFHWPPLQNHQVPTWSSNTMGFYFGEVCLKNHLPFMTWALLFTQSLPALRPALRRRRHAG